MTDQLSLTHYGSEIVAAEELAIVRIYEASHADVIEDPFYSSGRFMDRVRAYAKSPGFECVIARIDGAPVGLALGYALPENARWWAGLTTPVHPELIQEDGTRTFGLTELMTHPNWQGHGIAHRLHDELLYKRPEQRASLTVRSDNKTARQAYDKWGWWHMGKIKPFPDSPHYDALILDLTPK